MNPRALVPRGHRCTFPHMSKDPPMLISIPSWEVVVAWIRTNNVTAENIFWTEESTSRKDLNVALSLNIRHTFYFYCTLS
ncbi:hypothetical protein GDO81_023391 [Engystomops pustulosus]|uniref:Uncharacterized protein n=1 Tax=Engystomops pustulosus TaxID=76066 RepID=A0AAV6YKU2_ENGPU|nr:hypothetical protein GDO81_023391 [Engystomops pustulosus]